jgi:Na+/H+ antiporter NhaB
MSPFYFCPTELPAPSKPAAFLILLTDAYPFWPLLKAAFPRMIFDIMPFDLFIPLLLELRFAGLGAPNARSRDMFPIVLDP